ncbi:MAG: YqhA family protein [Gammaproteobacteria bacterium]
MNPDPPGVPSRRVHLIESLLIRGRWLLLPFYVGLLLSVIWLLVVFVITLVGGIALPFSEMGPARLLLWILRLVELTLVANLVVIVALSSFESFIAPRADTLPRSWPAWLGQWDDASLKLKLFASIMSIAAIELLEMDLKIDRFPSRDILWSLLILLTFVFAGLGVGWMDRRHRHPSGS